MRGSAIFTRLANGWLVFWLALFAVYIHMGALAFSGLVILLGAVGWWVWIAHRRDVPIVSSPARLAGTQFALFFAWLALSGLWSGAGPDTALRLGLQIVLSAAIPAYLLTRSEALRGVLAHILMAMSLAGVAVLAADVASGFGLNTFLDPLEAGGDMAVRQSDAEMNIGRGHVAYALTAPLLVALFATRLGKPRAWAASAMFLGLLLIGSLLNRLAVAPVILIGAAPLFLIGLTSPRWGLRLSLGTLCASILFAPIIGILSRMAGEGVMARLPMSWDHRLRMWDYSLKRIMEAPLIGQGLDSSRDMQEAFTTRIGVDVPFVSLHPHNLGLQTWMEAGAIGAILLTLALAALYRPLRRLAGGDRWRAAALSGVLMATAVASAITVGAWQYWWWGLIALALSLVILVPKTSS